MATRALHAPARAAGLAAPVARRFLVLGLHLAAAGLWLSLASPVSSAATPCNLQDSSVEPAFAAFKNARFGQRIEYPPAFFPSSDDIDDRAGRKFSSADGACRFFISGGANELGASAAEVAELTEQYYSDKDVAVTFRRTGERWYVIAGVDRSQIYYEKGMLSPDGKVIGVLLIEYPRSLVLPLRPIVARMSRSFLTDGGDEGAGTGGQGLAAAPRNDTAAGATIDLPELTPLGASKAVTNSWTNRLLISYADAEPASEMRARAIAGDLAAAGYDIAEIRRVGATAPTARIRYFSAADATALSYVGRDLAVALEKSGFRAAPMAIQDLASDRSQSQPGTIEIWVPNHWP
ncbi:MAG: hypothetical protein JWL84_3343 [Rhodospirillales bacterium]|nr:hypothetical protein [Rhodospirillales bacterium]